VARTPCPRRVAAPPRYHYFKPRGVPVRALEEVALSIDELEALRLADLEDLYQDDAARHMAVSRATFGRIVSAARRKVAAALVGGRALRIDGGAVAFVGRRHFRCEECRHAWSLAYGTGRPEACPACGATAFRRTDRGPRSKGPRPARRRRRRHGE
jgi:predicted DNA-binding protein (UPF0251 family)